MTYDPHGRVGMGGDAVGFDRGLYRSTGGLRFNSGIVTDPWSPN